MKNTKFFKKATAWTMLFALVLSYVYTGSFPFRVPITKAAINVTISTDGLPNGQMYNYPIKMMSDPKPIMRIQIWNNTPSNSLGTTTVNFDISTTTNFSLANDLFGLGTGSSSGIALYQDNGTTTGYFDSNDSVIQLSTAPIATTTGTSTAIIFPGHSFLAPPILTNNATTTFFVVIKTGSSAINGHRILASILPYGINTNYAEQGPNENFIANSYIIDTQSPGIAAVNYNTSNSVHVIFNEKIRSTAANMYYFYFNGTQAVGASVVNDYTVKVDSTSVVTTGTTWITASPEILDLAGNANASNSPITVTAALPKVLFSEISTDYINYGGDTEFIELYNLSESSVIMNGWSIQYSPPSTINWSTVGYISSSCPTTTIGPRSYYLLGGPGLNNVLATSTFKDCNFYNYNIDIFSTSGGHLRLINYSGQEIDRIGWGTAISPEGSSTPSHAPNQSWERKAFGNSTAASMAAGGADEFMGNGYDSNNNNFDFIVQPNSNPQNSSSTIEYAGSGAGSGASGLGIYHTPVNFAPLNTTLKIFAQMVNPALPPEQINTELHYMVGDGTPYNNATSSYMTAYGLHQGNGYFMFSVPATSTTANGLYYYLKLTSGSSTRLMSASPTADAGNNEATVATNPFIITCANPGTTYMVSGYATLNGLSDHSNILVLAEGTGYFATTSASGFFTLSIKPGNYNFVFIKNGYYENWINSRYINAATELGTKILYPGTSGGLYGDSARPTVKWTGPNNSSTGLPYFDSSFKIKMSFSKHLASSTFNISNIMLTTDGSSTVSNYSVAYNPERNNNLPSTTTDPYLGVINVPPTGLNPGTTYYVILNGNVRDWSGNSIYGNRSEGGYAFSFTTQGNTASSTYGSGANYPPTILDVRPSPGSINAAANTKITLTFSESMDYSSITTNNNIRLYRITYSNYSESTTTVPFSAELDTTGKIVLITPTSSLTANSKYRIVLTGALKSAAGVWMGNSLTGQNTNNYEVFRSSFETGSSGDSTVPSVLGSWPANNASYISVNPGSFNFQFNKNLNPTTVNANTVNLKQGSTIINTEIKYDSLANAIYIMPLNVLSASTTFTITLTGSSTGIKDMSGNAMTSDYIVNFVTANFDLQPPAMLYANANEYKLAITFSEPMNSATPADSYNWLKSVLNPANYIVRWGDPANVAGFGNIINLSEIGTQFFYDNYTNTVTLENLGLNIASTTNKDIYINLNYGQAADLSNNLVASSSNPSFQTPIKNSSLTGSNLGPNTSGTAAYNMGTMGMMKAGAWPKNFLAGLSTTYFIDIPTTKQIPIGGKIIITFPMGFSIGSAIMDQNSPVNNDINGDNTGEITVSSIVANEAGRYITITTASEATQPNDYLHMDIAEIINTAIPRGYETSGYTVDIKTLDQNDVMLESITAMPFFITPAGTNNLTINIADIDGADVDGVNDEVKIFLGSPLTGPMDKIATIADNGSGNVIFSGLPIGNYYIFTDPAITLDGHDYTGVFSPEPYYLASTSNKTISLTKEEAGTGKAEINIDINGDFGSESADIFASGPNSYKIKSVSGLNPSATFYLTDGNWMIGVVQNVPKGQMSGPSQMPDWMPPMPVQVTVSGNGATTTENNGTVNDGNIAFNIQSANKQIIGYVQDGTGSSTADAEVWAYQPGGTNGMGAHTRTDTNGKFILKLNQAGSYKIGVYKQGMPNVPERAVKITSNVRNDDGNTSADVYNETGSLITEGNLFVIKIKKPGYTIYGKITDGTNPVASTPVWANQANGSGYSNTMSDSAGNFILYAENGTWILNGYIPGYGSAEAKTVVVNSTDVSQNLAPNLSQNYYTVSGIVGIDTNGTYSNVETPFAYQPIRAVAYNAQGVYQGREYNTITDSTGRYRLTVPAGIYRVDIWTQQYGEIGINNQNQDNTLNEDGVDDKYINNAANVNAANNVSNADIIIVEGNLHNITVSFTNGTASQEGFIKIEGIAYPNGNSNPPVPTGYNNFIRVAGLNANTTVRLSDGDYLFSLEVPGLGRFKPASSSLHSIKKDIVVSADRIVEFVLPILGTDTVTVSGTITDGTNPLSEAWVWIKNPNTGYNFGTLSNASGTYSLNIPINNNYNIGADKLGFQGVASSSFNMSTTTTKNFILAASAQTISGYIYADREGGTNNQKDSGEEIPNGFVRAETTDGTKKSQAPVDGAGFFTLPVVNGAWKVFGMADGYQETFFGTSTVNNNNPTINIKLTVNNDWTNRTKSSSIIPSNGGTIDDTATSGTLIKLTFPPNALGNSSSAGNINANRTSSVSETNSSEIVGNEGVNVAATDNNGRAITNLNDYIDVEMLLYKSDVTTAIASGTLTYERLKNTTLSYWDSSANDWVSLPTTRTAYYKTNIGDTEWTLYANTSTTTEQFNAFINEIVAGSLIAADYKLSFTAKSNHLTIFAVIMPFVSTPAEAAPETPAPSNPPSSGGGGGSATIYCTTVTYDQWGSCIGGWRYRNVLTRTPNNCTLTTNQENARKEVCELALVDETIAKTVPDQQISTVTIIELYYSEAEMAYRADVNEIMAAAGVTARNHLGEELSRDTLINKLRVKLSTLPLGQQYALANFITYGTPATVWLGWRERAGVLNSYKAAFGRVPYSAADWQDVIKIGNGRWPKEKSVKAENNAKSIFKKIYQRDANMKNSNDNAAVTVISYGLRPAKRNFNSEKTAILIFKGIYKFNPSGATDWDAVRAIAYSGAKR
jgi:hypothetical protein